MKYIAGLFVLLFIHAVSASQCRVNGGKWESVAGGWFPLTVPLIPNPSSGRIDLDGYRMECRYTPESGPVARKDVLSTRNNGLYAPSLGNYTVGLRIGGVDRPVPVGTVHLATMFNNGKTHDLNTYMYILTRGSPGKPINIRAGDEIATLQLFQKGSHSDHPVDVILIAGNDLITEPSTCTINNNQPIDVNFNQVDRTLIGESVNSTPIRANIRLNYSCPDPGLTLPITITLKGASAGFDSGVLNMSNPNLGTGLLRAGVQVRPQGTFHTNIYNSSGGDDVTFALTRRPGSTPATGAFSGSATLVMGVP
ncbi:fimbrial protein [Pseudomonas sp. NPDC096917]|uniref:fimbrial protein n=1 Tax=Pseudomonas sp. NPDC096917 TaxID=3364483 RepID=UPI003839E095